MRGGWQSSGMPQGGNPLQQLQPGPQSNQSNQSQNQGTTQGAQSTGNGGTLNNMTGATTQQEQQQQSGPGQVDGNRTNSAGNQQRKISQLRTKVPSKARRMLPRNMLMCSVIAVENLGITRPSASRLQLVSFAKW